MDRCFIPYQGGEPLVIKVNGHDLVLVSFEAEAFEESEIFDQDPSSVEIRTVDIDTEGVDDDLEDDEITEVSAEILDGREVLDGGEDRLISTEDFSTEQLDTFFGGEEGDPEDLEDEIIEIEPMIPKKIIAGVTQLVAKEAQSGVLFVPPNVEVDSLLDQLTEQLPWLQ